MNVLTVPETAARLRLSAQWVYRSLRRGYLPGRKLGGVWRVPEHQLKEFLQGQPGSVNVSRPMQGRARVSQ